MSQSQRRAKNMSVASKAQPTILRNRKRKISENDTTLELESKIARREKPINKCTMTDDISSSSTCLPLEDITQSKLNIESRSITPDSAPDNTNWNKFRTSPTEVLTCYPTPQSKRATPLPKLKWADKEQLWSLMCKKDKKYRRDPDYLINHPSLEPRMRAILLDWITEVCEVYKLHRETYYLAVYYIDIYLTRSKNVPKQQLQLIGITSLFIAAKIEEIYPPKLAEFSYVTDSACSDTEILEKELVILKVLNWDLSPMTAVSWLNTYLQLIKIQPSESNTQQGTFEYPQYSGLMFVQVARLLDLCTLELSSLQFSPSRLAATALSYYNDNAYKCSGFSKKDLQECYEWMSSFKMSLEQGTSSPNILKHFESIPGDDLHNIQTHSVDLGLLESAQKHLTMNDTWRKSPPISQINPEVLTPPKSDEKSWNKDI